MNEVMIIEGMEIERIEYNGQAVLSLPMVDAVHQRPPDTAGRNFRENRDRFILGLDFFELGYEIWSALSQRISSDEGGNSSDHKSAKKGYKGSMIFLTVRGYLKLVKSFKDDLSWRVQDMLVDGYFRLKEVLIQARQQTELNVMKERLLETQRKLIEQLERKRPRVAFSAEEVTRIRALAEEGKTSSEIGPLVGRNPSSIRNLLRAWGFEPQKPYNKSKNK